MQLMTEEEIRRDIRLSANPEKQVCVLAEINLTLPKIIRRINDGQTWEEASARIYPKPKYISKGIYKPWTYLEVQRLKELYKCHMRRKKIAEELERSDRSVANKLSILKREGEII